MLYGGYLTKSKDIIANTIAVIDTAKVIDLKELLLSTLDAVNNIVGLPVETLNTLQQLAEAINSDAVFDTIMKAFNLKPIITYVNTQFVHTITQFLNYDTRDESTIKFLTKSYKINTYNKSEVDSTFSSLIGAVPAILYTIVELATAFGNDQSYATNIQNQINNNNENINTDLETDADVLLYIVQAGINTCVLINAVDLNSKFKIISTYDNVLKLQKNRRNNLIRFLRIII